MKWTGLNEIREMYLSYFESLGHLRLPSFPLIPHGDKSLLLINSGMAPMKKYFTGEEEPPCHRVTTCQKCIRTPDLERVGHTARHGTYFEMLGNFSFGDYFKEEAIPFAWEFLTKVMEIPADKLWPSIYENDEEAFAIWHDKVGIPAERIVRLGKGDNFWEHGTGPCGPCSEIYFDRGEKYGCGSPDCRPGCDCDRFMEIWNNVFSQFDNKGGGVYEELKQKNIDTGMGLDRLACVMQGVDNMFEVDTTKQIVACVAREAGKQYGANADDDVSVRVVTDHVRASSFMICDGVLPSNEGRGYVLRRLLRRAARHGKLLGINRPFLAEVCEVVILTNEGAYPELREKEAFIKKVISMEEERFDATVDAGLGILQQLIADAKAAGSTRLAGADVFRLSDTYGFPIDLSREIAAEAGIDVDEDTFAALMQEQRKRARDARASISGWSAAAGGMPEELEKTVFLGYTETEAIGTVLSLLQGGEAVGEVKDGDCTVVLDRTPFYGEGGGQVGDTGTLTVKDTVCAVLDCKKQDGVYLHICHVSGTLHVGDAVTAKLDVERRDAIRRNHSAAHLLQAALRQVLGSHVEQAGSYVDAERVRFDFSHYQAMTPEEIRAVEKIVNAAVFAAMPIKTTETDLETAKKSGAMALFGEKYGKVVRMVQMGTVSTELCGGTHMDNTARLGAFRIIAESSVAAGVRRIEGTTGTGVLALLDEAEETLNETARELKAQNVHDVVRRAATLEAELHEAKRRAEQAEAKLAAAGTAGLAEKAQAVGSLRLLLHRTDGMTVEAVRTVCDSLREKDASLVAVILTAADGKYNLVAAAGEAAVAAGAHAGNLVRALAKLCGGGGGGRADSATAGIKNADGVEAAFAAAPGILQEMLH